MSDMTQAPAVPPPAPRPFPAVAALLSLAVPGLGQMFQGLISRNGSRFAKGLMFLLIIWGMFFYGFWLGQYRNVWLPHKQEELIDREERAGRTGQLANRFWFTRSVMPALLGNLCQRWQYLGQFWNGLPAWPALWNYYFPGSPILGDYQPSPGAVPANLDRDKAVMERAVQLRDFEEKQNEFERQYDRRWDLAWIYTMISGMLNLLVIYDTVANPVAHEPKDKKAGKGDAK